MRYALIPLLVLFASCSEETGGTTIVDEHADHDHGEDGHDHDHTGAEHRHVNEPLLSGEYAGMTPSEVVAMKRAKIQEEAGYATAITEVDIEKFLAIQTRFKGLPHEARDLGLTGMAAGTFVSDEFNNMLENNGMTTDSWSKLYQRLKMDVRNIEEGRTEGLMPHYEKELELVEARLIEIVGAFQQ